MPDRRLLTIGNREHLAPEYVDAYTAEVLDDVDLDALAESLPAAQATVVLCVERDPEACHRSLIAERLGDRGVEVEHLRP